MYRNFKSIISNSLFMSLCFLLDLTAADRGIKHEDALENSSRQQGSMTQRGNWSGSQATAFDQQNWRNMQGANPQQSWGSNQGTYPQQNWGKNPAAYPQQGWSGDRYTGTGWNQDSSYRYPYYTVGQSVGFNAGVDLNGNNRIDSWERNDSGSRGFHRSPNRKSSDYSSYRYPSDSNYPYYSYPYQDNFYYSYPNQDNYESGYSSYPYNPAYYPNDNEFGTGTYFNTR